MINDEEYSKEKYYKKVNDIRSKIKKDLIKTKIFILIGYLIIPFVLWAFYVNVKDRVFSVALINVMSVFMILRSIKDSIHFMEEIKSFDRYLEKEIKEGNEDQ